MLYMYIAGGVIYIVVENILMLFAVDILFKATGNAPIMKKSKWSVEENKSIATMVDFIRRYLKTDTQQSIVSGYCVKTTCDFLSITTAVCVFPLWKFSV